VSCGHIIAPLCGCPAPEASAPKKPKNARHSKENPDWQTPQLDIDCARAALGGAIDLDPFSCVSGNARVGAGTWFGPDHPNPNFRDGFAMSWKAGTVFVNHPGGTTKRAWKKSVDEWLAGNCSSIVWMGFSVEQVCILSDPNGDFESDEARWARGAFVPTDFSLCFLRQRIAFIDANNPTRPPRPAHANYVLGIGVDLSRFEAAYRGRGQVIHGSMAGANGAFGRAHRAAALH
jgi:hypothetical protein